MAIHSNFLGLGNPMDRGAWWAAVHGVARVGHDLVTKPTPSLTLGQSDEQALSLVRKVIRKVVPWAVLGFCSPVGTETPGGRTVSPTLINAPCSVPGTQEVLSSCSQS